MSKYWLAQWLDDKGIKTVEELRRAFSQESTFKALAETAEAIIESPSFFVADERPASYALASRKMDLSANLSCPSWICQRPVIEELFFSTWHYFDKIVVQGFSPYDAVQMLHYDGDDKEHFWRNFIGYHAETFLRLRGMGADELLDFQQKFIPCPYHWKTHLQETGLYQLIADSDDIIAELEHNGKIVRLEQRPSGNWGFEFRHPLFEIPLFGNLPREPDDIDPAKEPRRAVAQGAFKILAGSLVSDVRIANMIKTPVIGGFAKRSGRQLSSDDVAMQLNLPILDGLPLPELLAVRKAEGESFERFRTAIRLAVKERVRNSEQEGSSAIAEEIVNDVVVPAILDISQRLRAAEKVLAKKTALSTAVGSIVTVAGLIKGIPLLLPIGVSAGVSSTLHAAKYFEEKRDIELHDMYFLYKLEILAPHSELDHNISAEL